MNYKETGEKDVIKYLVKKLGYSKKQAKKEIKEYGMGWLSMNQWLECIRFTQKMID